MKCFILGMLLGVILCSLLNIACDVAEILDLLKKENRKNEIQN